MASTTLKKLTAIAAGMAAMAGGLALAGSATAAQPYDIIVHAASSGQNTLKGRQLTAYKLADYVDGTYVSVGDKSLDGVAVDTPAALEKQLNRVLAKTTGKAVTALPGWTEAGEDPIAWMGGFRQTGKDATHSGDDQSAGSFGFGWNESGPQHNGNISPDKAYTGSVREFADNLVKDSTAMAEVRKQPHSATITCSAGDSCTIPLTATQGTGIYLIIDSAGVTSWSGTNKQGYTNTWKVGTTQPMIVPTKADSKDLATLSGYTPSDPNKLGTTGKLGEITLKNVVDEEVMPPHQPKQRDETVNNGKDAADNGSDLGDVVPYVVNYRVPDLSAFKNAYDNADPWIYNYRVMDSTQPGLKITSAPTVDLYSPDANLYDKDGKVLSKALVTGKNGQHMDPVQSITLTKVDTLPDFAKANTGTKDGQPNEPDAWYYLATDANDHSYMVVGLGKWVVKNYGNLKLNDKTKTLYQSQFSIRYNATVTPKILAHQNMTNNDNWLDYSDTPSDVNSGSHHETPHTRIRQWTYDIDLHKRASTSNAGLEGAKFQVTFKQVGHRYTAANATDAKNNKYADQGAATDLKKVGGVLEFVSMGTAGEYRLAVPGDAAASKTTTLVTGKDGLLSLKGLDLGTYTLKETEPAHNYQLLPKTEDVRISAKYIDDKSNLVTPDYQSESRLTISKNNSIIPLVRPMFNFAVTQDKAPAGLTITSTDAYWHGQDASGKWIADDKTDWVSTDLTLWNQPNNVMLSKTGGYVGFGLIVLLGGGMIAGGLILLVVRRRRDQARK